ncbi:MAG: FtsX-like permease family protein [Bacteroidota bacterium]
MKREQVHPPKYARKFLLWFLKDEIAEEVEGDLYEMFCYNQEHGSQRRATLNYWFQVLNYMRPFAVRGFQTFIPTYFNVQVSYIKIAFRIFSKNKLSYLINTTGLGLALACCITAYLFVAYEWEFDSHHQSPQTANIYKIHSHVSTAADREIVRIQAPIPLATELSKENTSIITYCRYLIEDGLILSENQQPFREEIAFADPAFFEMFNFPLLAGNEQNFKVGKQIFLSRAFAETLFGWENPIGKTLSLHVNNKKTVELMVGGVLERVPDNNSFIFNVLLPFETFLNIYDIDLDSWSEGWEPSTFIQLAPGTLVKNVSVDANSFVSNRNDVVINEQLRKYTLEPFLSSFHYDEIESSYVHLRVGFLPLIVTGFMALMILLIACFNLTNTMIAITNKRLKEIGLRKSIGANSFQIFSQFLTESFLVLFFSLILGGFLSIWVVGEFRSIANFKFGLEDVNNTNLLLAILVLTVFASVLGGFFPALQNSKLSPVHLIKGSNKLRGTNWFTRILISTEFALTVIFLIAGQVFYQNIDFQESIDFGFAKEEVFVVPIEGEGEYLPLKAATENAFMMEEIGASVSHIGLEQSYEYIEVGNQKYEVNAIIIGENYLESMGFELSPIDPSTFTNPIDNGIWVNEAFLKKTKLRAPFKEKVFLQSRQYQIIGLVNDHIDGLQDGKEARPFVFYEEDPANYAYMVFQAKAGKLEEGRAYVEESWNELFPNRPFESFLQEDLVLESYQQANAGLGKIFLFLTLIGAALSLAGIFSLARLNIAKQKKEIGIRKILGASFFQIHMMINREFLAILSVAVLLGGILGKWMIVSLLEATYSYHTEVEIWPVFLAASLIFGAGLFTTSLTILGATLANPVHAVRQA